MSGRCGNEDRMQRSMKRRYNVRRFFLRLPGTEVFVCHQQQLRTFGGFQPRDADLDGGVILAAGDMG